MIRNTCAALALVACLPAAAAELVVAVPKATADDPAWKKVAQDYAKERKGELVVWDGAPEQLLPALKKHDPRYLTIIGKPEAFNAAFVRAVNRVTRTIDDDPWTDCQWGLVSGYTPKDAAHVLAKKAPLVIQRALTTTGITNALVDSVLTISDGKKGEFTRKAQGKEPVQEMCDLTQHPNGTVELFEKAWNDEKPQLLVTSAHATQFNLEMPWGLGLIASHGGQFRVVPAPKRNAFAKFLGGAMFVGDTQKLGAWLVEEKFSTLKPSPEPKVWLASGNCLIGDAAKTTDSMVLTAMSEAGVNQFVGYVVPTWFGRNGWGTTELWQKQAGNTSLSEAFFLNNQKLLDETQRRFPEAMGVTFDSDDIDSALKSKNSFTEGLTKLQKEKGIKLEQDLMGLVHDRDVVAFWGDPMWNAGFDLSKNTAGLKQVWSKKDNKLTLTIESSKGYEGGYAAWLPKRMRGAKLGSEADAVLADDFLLVRALKLNAGEKKDFVISM